MADEHRMDLKKMGEDLLAKAGSDIAIRKQEVEVDVTKPAPIRMRESLDDEPDLPPISSNHPLFGDRPEQ